MMHGWMMAAWWLIALAVAVAVVLGVVVVQRAARPAAGVAPLMCSTSATRAARSMRTTTGSADGSSNADRRTRSCSYML